MFIYNKIIMIFNIIILIFYISIFYIIFNKELLTKVISPFCEVVK